MWRKQWHHFSSRIDNVCAVWSISSSSSSSFKTKEKVWQCHTVAFHLKSWETSVLVPRVHGRLLSDDLVVENRGESYDTCETCPSTLLRQCKWARIRMHISWSFLVLFSEAQLPGKTPPKSPFCMVPLRCSAIPSYPEKLHQLHILHQHLVDHPSSFHFQMS